MRVIFAGGGTAGHINPAIAIAKYIKKKESKADILFVGTEHGLEKSLVPREGFNIRFINVRGFRRKISFDTILTVTDLFRGLGQAAKIIKEYKPDIVIGTGGYVCGPVVFVAHLMGIRTIVHEQNVFPGVTVKILARFANIVAVSFEDSKRYIKANRRIILTGNPIKQGILETGRDESRKSLGVDERPFVLVFGGSLGAEKINESMIELLKEVVEDNKIQLMFSTGEREYDRVKKRIKDEGINIEKNKNIKVVPYIYNMDEAISAADLVVCRAGAITLAELTAKGIPSILIPSPNVTNNHQEYNARVLEKTGAAEVLTEDKLDGITLRASILRLLGDKKLLREMASRSYAMGIRDATHKIYSEINLLLFRK